MASFLPMAGSRDDDDHDMVSERDEEEQYDDDGNFRPTVQDVQAVHVVFAGLQPLLPPEMVDRILDLAEYWPCSTQTVDFTGKGDGSGKVYGNTQAQDKLIVRS